MAEACFGADGTMDVSYDAERENYERAAIVTWSFWAKPKLSPQQIAYASYDAQVSRFAFK